MSSSRADRGDEFPLRLAAWLGSHRDLIDGLLALRRLGPDATAAVEAVMNLQPVATMRLSLELWRALVEDQGLDPDSLLAKQLPEHLISELCAAVRRPGSETRPLRAVAGQT